MIIEELEGLESNDIFEAAQLYIGARTASTSSSATRLKVRKHDIHTETIQVNVDRDEEVVDEFEGIKFKWQLNCRHVESRNYNPRDLNSTLRSEVRAFHLTFHKKFKRSIALEKYLPYILKEAKAVKLFSVDPGRISLQRTVKISLL